MKKLLCMILALIMVLSLCACGQEKPNNESIQPTNGQNNNTIPTSNPTDGMEAVPSFDEEDMMEKYKEIHAILKKYTSGEEIAYNKGEEWVRGHAALEAIYNALSDMEELDKWYGSEWMPESDSEIDWNRQNLLAGFTVHKDVLLKQDGIITGITGDTNDYQNVFEWNYNADGTVASVKWSKTIFHNFIPYIYGLETEVFYELVRQLGNETEGAAFIYAEDGTLEQVKILGYVDDDGDNYHNGKTGTQILLTLKRDANGNVSGADWVEWQDRKGTIALAYDAQGRLADATFTTTHNDTWWEDICFTYTYDENGLHTVAHSIEKHFKGEVTGGALGSHTVTQNSGEKTDITLGRGPFGDDETTVTFEYDAQGRLVTATQGEGKMGEKNYSEAVFQYTYGDVYTYAPAE